MSTLSPVHVIGHLNPDTDAIASAIGYAWLLRERDGLNAIAARAGAVTPQTAWVLKTAGLEAPHFLADASPRFERIARTLPPVLPDRPLREAWAVASASHSGAPIVDADGAPLGMVTGNSVFHFFSRQMEQRVDLENVSVARVLNVPCRDAMDADVPRFTISMRVRDGRGRVAREERDDFFVIREDGAYFGICRSPDVLNPPRMQIVLVDHNEPSQAIGALEEADLLEVLDHHRLGNPPTKTPIPFTIDPVGSTSTLVGERIAAEGLTPPPGVAVALLGGLMADTLILKSPTTTERDHRAAEQLAKWALAPRDGGIPFADYRAFGKAVLGAGAGLGVRTIESVINSDLKIYEGGGIKFGLAQVEAANLLELSDRLGEISAGLEALCQARGLALAVLMVTDVVRSASRLVLAGAQAARLDPLPYTRLADGTLDAPDLVSRKKQLLPAILGMLE
ncbi:MAG: DHH family phosphoesterase [Chloroflexi bacterium]|nr:DHH family phosphoesterase [Chloroflexota bacterium]MBI2976784.1 DHH family phosphoesterase [Chloroflexota bacterium]MBI5292714.1 DHH family phosphoesterase [Chloroflexota bacterium]